MSVYVHTCVQREERKNGESSILVYCFVTFILRCVFSVLRISKRFVLAWDSQNQRLFYPPQLMNPSFWEWHANSCPPTIWFSLSTNDLSACALKTRLKNAGFYSQLKIHVWQRPKERKGIWKSFNHYLPRHFQVTRGSALSLSPDHYFWLAWTRPCFQWCA